jgi:N-acetyl-D-muramate 6-phosphate phosphatase
VIRSVVFDVGETILDDTREFGAWADWIGVPRHTFSAVLGAVTAEGRNNVETFEYFCPGFDLGRERQLREAAGRGEQIDDSDLYPDVRGALGALHDLGLWVGVAGNQTRRVGELLRDLALPVDGVATSAEWGVAKPAPAFFDHLADFATGERHEIAYVGDHRDNDIVSARAAGFVPVFVKRGPWGHLWASDRLVTKNAEWIISSLNELPDLVRPTR